MNNEREKIINKVEECLRNYKGDDSIYYKQLKESFEEYKSLKKPDQVTNDIYVKHLNELCDYIKERKNANRTITILIIFSIFIIGISAFTSYKYYNLTSDLKENIIKHNGSTSLNVHFNNSLNFDANKLSDIEHFKDLAPMTFSILATNKDNDDVMVHYDVYLIEQNDDIPEENKITKEAFLYNVNSDTRESGVKALKDATSKNDKLLIFSGETKTNIEENIEIRMWIDSNTNLDYINKKYKFKIYVDGYVV
ncbi:MAG: hypothetical protein J1F35_06865 [Erysipelotrichales bacterium]|nr:hypothetical protein [Erysipelotrichales bacterium]